MPYKIRLVTEMYLRKPIAERLKSINPVGYAHLKCSAVAWRRIAHSARERVSFPKPYYSGAERKELALRYELFERSAVNAWLAAVYFPEVDAGECKAINAWLANPRPEQTRV